MTPIWNMRIHGVSTDFIRQLQQFGYKQVPTDELIDMRIHGVTVEDAKRVTARYPDVTVDELVNMRIQGR